MELRHSFGMRVISASVKPNPILAKSHCAVCLSLSAQWLSLSTLFFYVTCPSGHMCDTTLWPSPLSVQSPCFPLWLFFHRTLYFSTAPLLCSHFDATPVFLSSYFQSSSVHLSCCGCLSGYQCPVLQPSYINALRRYYHL